MVRITVITRLRVDSWQRAVIEGLSVDEMLSAGLELTVRGAMMTLSAREYTKRRASPDVSQQLAEEKEAANRLPKDLEALTLTHKGCSDREKELQAELKGVRDDLASSKSSLKAIQTREEELVKKMKKLELEARELEKRVDGLSEKKERLSADLLATKAENARLSEELAKANDTIANLDATSAIETRKAPTKQ